jgi:hypothetical protein
VVGQRSGPVDDEVAKHAAKHAASRKSGKNNLGPSGKMTSGQPFIRLKVVPQRTPGRSENIENFAGYYP